MPFRTAVTLDLQTVRRRLSDVRRGFSYATALLGEPVDSNGARAAIKTRLATRVAVFLETVERGIFAHPESPYRPLLDAAGYDLARIRDVVARYGIEETLRRLCQDGVFVSIEEFKGIREARRGPHAFRFGERDFRNPLAASGMRGSSGGTRSQRTMTTFSVATRRISAEHRAMALAAYGLEGASIAICLPHADVVSFGAALDLAAMRRPPARWFTQLPHRFADPHETYAYYLGVKGGARFRGITLPSPSHVPFGEEARILRWVTEEVGGHDCAIFATAGAALRLALAAKRANAKLSNLTFLTSSEPLTNAKLAAIQAVGARAFSYFAFGEFGRAAYGCARPASADDMHVCRDAIAIGHRRRAVDQLGSEVDALLFTTLRLDAGRILLNVETGDFARITARQCGCLLGTIGWVDHLEEIRSFEKLNAEGPYFLGSKLLTLVEEILPAQFGGDATDYQLLQHEDTDGHTRLSVLVHPRLGGVDDDAVLDCVQRALGESFEVGALIWRRAGVLQVRRAVPMMTRFGKLMPLHFLEPDRPPAAVQADRGRRLGRVE